MKVSRRHLIQSAGVLLGASTAHALPPATRLLSLILRDAVAKADGGYTIDRNFLSISLFGAPGRWLFDHFLKTKPSDNVNPNPMAATRLVQTNGIYSSAEYATIDYKGVQVPALWGTNIQTSQGPRPMSGLLEHMIVFRGYGTGVDGHPGNLVKQYMPLPSAGSLTGQVADHSEALMKAIQFPSSIAGMTAFSSLKGVGASAVGYNGVNTNAIAQMLRPFTKRGEAQGLETLRTRYRELIGVAQDVLNQHAQQSFPGMESVAIDQDKAVKTLRNGLEDLDAAWSGLYGKYNALVHATFRDLAVPGYTNLPVPATDDGSSLETYHSITGGGGFLFPVHGFDLRNLIANATLDIMAQSFALAEFVYTRGLSNAMEIGSLNPNNLVGEFSRQGTTKFDAPRSMSIGFDFDQHNGGQISSIVLNSALYRALAAAMTELVDQLKAKNLFGKTIIHVTAEFGRIPRESGGGSDHGFDAMVSSVFTGMRTGGPLVLGNIRRDGSNGAFPANYSGTFGYKAPTNIAGTSTVLTPSHVASSLAILFGLRENPWGNVAAPLVYLENGQVKSKASAEIA